jgi:uncharacterized surface protein with fasciclin (FAS1) repeats
LPVVVAVVALFSLALVGCSGDDDQPAAPSRTTVPAKPPASASGTIVDYLRGDSDLSELASLVAGTTLEQTLAGDGPFTLFAPTNAALAALSDDGAALTDPATRTEVLNRHVVSSKLEAADLIPLDGKTVDTMGGPVPVTIDGSTLEVGGAPVTRTDVLTSNGVIHLVGAVVGSSS